MLILELKLFYITLHQGWGLGVRGVPSLALSACLASAASTQSLQARSTDGCHLAEYRYCFFQSLLYIWSFLFDTPPTPLPSKLYFWDRPVVLVDKAAVQSSLSSLSQRARFFLLLKLHTETMGCTPFPLLLVVLN